MFPERITPRLGFRFVSSNCAIALVGVALVLIMWQMLDHEHSLMLHSRICALPALIVVFALGVHYLLLGSRCEWKGSTTPST